MFQPGFPAAFLRALPRGLTVVVAIAFVVLNGLGVWQMQRLHWKETLVADLARTQALPPVPIDEALAGPQPAWRSVSLPACDIRQNRSLAMHSALEGEPGYRILTACPAGSGTVLVDLGFAPEVVKPEAQVGTPVGRLRPFEKPGMVTPPNDPVANDWYWRSAAEMGAALQAQDLRADYFVVLDLKASGIAVDGLQQGAMTAPLTNRHLEYALTWFALAWTLMAVFAALVMQRMKAA